MPAYGKVREELDWSEQRQTRAVAEYLAALDAAAEPNPDCKVPKVGPILVRRGRPRPAASHVAAFFRRESKPGAALAPPLRLSVN